MKLEVGKTYRTRNGDFTATVIAIDAAYGKDAAILRYTTTGRVITRHSNGRSDLDEDTGFDFVEEVLPIVWANVYRNTLSNKPSIGRLFPSKGEAIAGGAGDDEHEYWLGVIEIALNTAVRS